MKSIIFSGTLKYKQIIQSRKKELVDVTIPKGHKVKIKEKKKRQILGPCQRAEKAVKHESDGETNCSWCLWNSPQRTRD